MRRQCQGPRRANSRPPGEGGGGGSGWFLINFPELFLDLGGQRVKEVLLHHQARPLELPALAQLHRQTLQPVAPQLQLRQRRQLAEARRQRLQAVVAQVERAQLLALEQLVGQALDLQRRAGGRRKKGVGISSTHFKKYTLPVASLDTPEEVHVCSLNPWTFDISGSH